ncbi:MAG TPA: OmpA family protein [Stellaceae bacterium]|jgi:outer membrane protein OmpA-like peptidoglycan-associated protein|nr:OmpA family protein [Stellaceae bacterium]
MKWPILPVMIGLALALCHIPALHADTAQLGANATAGDFVNALKRPKMRGIVVHNANPAAEANAPSVAVDIKFQLNSSTLTDEAKETIKQLALAMKSDDLATDRFRLDGHTDTTGKPGYNMRLSKRRAAAVRDYLIRTFGIKSNRLEAVGHGQTMLLDPANPTSPVNRRVQIVNLGEN